ncbi:MAG: FAD-dependent oxidoreductase, partial [Anaerolineae bacterium]
LTYEIENYPGFPQGLSGQELVEYMKAQAERFGARIKLFSAVTAVDFSKGSPFWLKTDDDAEYLADAVIVTAGATARRLNVPGEKEFTGHGVSYCATCDGFFFRGKEVAVIGGGDSALQEALFLTRFASRVYIIHRRNQLRAGATLQRRAHESPKIEFIWNSVVESINGDAKVESITLKNVVTGEVTVMPIAGVFVYIGHLPNNQLFIGKLAMDEQGYLITDRLMRTSVPGIFAAGEIQDHRFKQAATSVGQGVAAAMEAEKYLANLS